MMLRSILQDMRYAMRQWRRAPGFALTVVAVLALGVGANIAVFTLLNGIMLRPLPYSDPDRVVAVELNGPLPYYSFTYANMLQLRDAIGPKLKIGAVLLDDSMSSVSATGPGGRFQLDHAAVTSGLFDMLGVQPILGRTFRSEENEPGRNQVVLIGEDVWHRLFLSDRNIIGKSVFLRRKTYTIIGVLPKSFSFWGTEQMGVWTPGQLTPANHTAMSGKDAKFGSLYVRIPDNMTTAQLAANLNLTQANVAKEVADGNVPASVKVTPYRDTLIKSAGRPLWMLYAVVIGIWVLACLNVTSLMLARAVSRTREQAVRAAIGARPVRLFQQSVVESILLSAIGAAVGMLLGQSIIKLLWRQIERNLPLTKSVHVDTTVLACLLGLTLVTAAITGIFPALRAMRRDVRESLNGIAATSSARANRTRELLVIGQLALTLVFLVGAGLFLRTIHALRQVPLGFSQQNVLTGGLILNGKWTDLQDGDLSNQPNIVDTSYLPLLQRLGSIPGVKAVALSSVLPLRSEMSVSIISNLDHKDLPFDKNPKADGRIASPGLVDALGIPMIRGRFFADDDTATTPPVVVVNQAFANKYLPGEDPIGHTVSMAKSGRFADIRIVGVIGDMKQLNVSDTTKPEIYFCLAQTQPGTPLYGIATSFIQVAIRAAVPADTLRAQFDKALHEVAPDATTTDVKTIHQAVEDSFGSQTMIARLLGTFAVLALAIASVGLYGLLSFAVAQRTREIGIRMALGAQQTNILALVLYRAVLVVAVGLALGGSFAWFAARFAESYVYGVQAHDLLTFVGVTLVLTASSLFAAWLPARRAVAVDPILALRSE
jgi:predicted permease